MKTFLEIALSIVLIIALLFGVSIVMSVAMSPDPNNCTGTTCFYPPRVDHPIDASIPNSTELQDRPTK